MGTNTLPDLFNAFSNYRVMVIGDVMVDSYLWGEVTRISPEAPVPILSKSARENRLGGAANVALNLQAMGATPILCAIVGNDTSGQLFRQLLQQNQLTDKGIIASSQRITTVKTRIISQNHHLLRVDDEDTTPITPTEETQLVSHIQQLLSESKIHAIIFEDYDKGVITPAIINQVVEMAQQKGIPTLVDPKKRNFSHYHHVNFFKPNFKEFKEGRKLDIDKNNKAQLIAEAKAFMKETGIQTLMITLAEHGVFICSEHHSEFFPAQVRKIADVSGAGDTVISVSALCLAAGMPIEEIAQIANMAGGLVCEKPGVVPIDKQLLLSECQARLTR
jgi:rfaE bifunctional protein kinase chain/domain